MKYDVAIIGTGPAGGMAAWALSKTGLRTVILEKEALPRHKPCGGAIAGSAGNLFEYDINPVIENRVGSIKQLYDFDRPHFSPSPGSPVLLVNRTDFDAYLVRQSLQSANGAIILREGFQVTGIEENDNHIVIYGKGAEPVIADYLIGADGATGKTADCLGLNRDRLNAIAIDAEVEVTTETYARESGQMTFNYFCVPCGYGWIFPKKNNLLSCGIGVWDGRINMKKAMSAFLENSFSPGAIIAMTWFGHPIPIYAGHRRIASKRTCLVGDAASLVDPVIGEGIQYALKSGMVAAAVIAGLHGAGIDDEVNDAIAQSETRNCGIYEKLVYAMMGERLDRLYRFELLPYLQAPDFYYNQYVLGH